MSEYVDFHYMPLEGKITGKQVLKQTEDAINDLGEHVYELDIDERRIDEAVEKSEQAIETADAALSAVTTDRAVWKNTVAEMKATDIDLGVTAATRGKMVFNDGNGAFYGVRSEKSGDVDSDDTVFLNNGNVAERIQSMNIIAKGNNIIFVANVAELIDSDALIGNVYGTTGYYSVNDGGSALYTIRAKDVADVEDGGSIIFLDNGNVAELITNGTANVKQFGAYGDGTHDDTNAVQNAVNFNNYVVFPQGTYLLGTVNITRDTTVFADTEASIKLKYTNGETYETVFSCDGCTLNVKGIDFVGTIITNTGLGPHPIPHVLYGENNGTINVESCGFTNVQFDKGVSQGSVLNGQVGTLLTTFDCDVSFEHIRIINCYGELTHCHHTVATVDDIEKDGLFEDIYMENNTGSINCMARNLIVKHFRGSHTIYNGSIVNAFGIKNILLEDIDVASNASNPVDTTEGGLIRCEKIVVKDVPTLTKVYGEEIEIYNSNVVNSRVNRQNNAWSPYSVKSNPSKCNVNAINCIYYGGETNTQSVTDVPVNYIFDTCVLSKQNLYNSGYETTDSYITCRNCKVRPGNFFWGCTTFIDCEIIDEFASGTAYIFGNANATSGVPKDDEYIVFSGCWCKSEITLYMPWINNVDRYIIIGCHNIVSPYT